MSDNTNPTFPRQATSALNRPSVLDGFLLYLETLAFVFEKRLLWTLIKLQLKFYAWILLILGLYVFIVGYFYQSSYDVPHWASKLCSTSGMAPNSAPSALVDAMAKWLPLETAVTTCNTLQNGLNALMGSLAFFGVAFIFGLILYAAVVGWLEDTLSQKVIVLTREAHGVRDTMHSQTAPTPPTTLDHARNFIFEVLRDSLTTVTLMGVWLPLVITGFVLPFLLPLTSTAQTLLFHTLFVLRAVSFFIPTAPEAISLDRSFTTPATYSVVARLQLWFTACRQKLGLALGLGLALVISLLLIFPIFFMHSLTIVALTRHRLKFQ